MPTNKTTAKSTKTKTLSLGRPLRRRPRSRATASSKATARTSASKKVTRDRGNDEDPSEGVRSFGGAVRTSFLGEIARPGDIIVIDSTQVGSPAREGEVLKVTVGEFSVRYQVRWGDGRETIISPSGGTARIIRT